MRFRIWILVFSLLVISCKKQENRILTFDLKKLPKIENVKLSDLGFVDVKYIPLETNEQCMISGINDSFMPTKIIVGKRFYLVYHFNTILMFLNNGSFFTSIGKVGRGPNEFTVAHDVKIDELNQNIYVLARWQKKFFVYSDRGELIRTFHIPIFPNEFSFYEKSIICYSENHMGNIGNSYDLIDKEGSIIKSYPNKYSFNNHDAYFTSGENLFYRFGQRLFKKEVYSDTIFLFEKEGFKPHIVIQVGNKLLTPNARSNFDGLYLGKNYIQPLYLFEFGDYIYYEFVYRFVLPNDILIYSFIGSKKGKFQALFNSPQGLINDLDGGPNILPRAIKDDNTIIGWVEAVKLKTQVASEYFKNSTPKYPEKKKELEKLANSIKETDNPVLILVSMKK